MPYVNEDVRKNGFPRAGLLETLCFYWSQETPDYFEIQDPSIVALASYPLRIIAAEWNRYVALMSNRIKVHEFSDKSSNFLDQIEKLNKDLLALQSWRRRSLSSQGKIRAIARFLTYHSKAASAAGKAVNPDLLNLLDSLSEDFDYIGLNMDECARRLESMLPVVTSLAHVVDSRRSYKETANISRLTILALVFVPLSFVSSVFSMNNGIGPGEDKFWIYFVVAIPLSCIVFLVATPPKKQIRRLYQKVWGPSRGEQQANKPSGEFAIEKSLTARSSY